MILFPLLFPVIIYSGVVHEVFACYAHICFPENLPGYAIAKYTMISANCVQQKKAVLSRGNRSTSL